jgi:hypothetical protein
VSPDANENPPQQQQVENAAANEKAKEQRAGGDANYDLCDSDIEELEIEYRVSTDSPTAQEAEPKETRRHRCPKNFEGSSKSMESKGAIDLLTQAWNAGSKGNKYYVAALVGDDDSTTRAVCQHSLQEKLDSGKFGNEKDFWPRRTVKQGKSKGKEVLVRDTGKLPLSVEIPPKRYYADPTHRLRVYGKAMFGLTKDKSVPVKERMKSFDAERMKRNLGCCFKQSVGKSFDELQKAMKGCFGHMYNQHENCDAKWCRYKGKPELIKEAEPRFGIIPSHKHTITKKVHDQYATDEMMRMCHHPFSSQKNESFNKKVTKLAPKDKCFGRTKSLEDRVRFAVILDSVGYVEGIGELMMAIYGEDFQCSAVAQRWCAQADTKERTRREYVKLPPVKRRRGHKTRVKIKEGLVQQIADRKSGHTYGSAIAINGDNVNKNEQPKEKTKKAPKAAKKAKVAGGTKAVKPCKCGSTTHQRTTHKDCTWINANNDKANNAGNS